jgi:hypothetical protein
LLDWVPVSCTNEGCTAKNRNTAAKLNSILLPNHWGIQKPVIE